MAHKNIFVLLMQRALKTTITQIKTHNNYGRSYGYA